ncbi:MAG: acyl transferase [Flavisolibacter sp.]
MQVTIPKAIELEQEVFNIHNEKDFLSIALAVFRFQFSQNPVYRQYCEAIQRTPDRVNQLHEIPFLPITFFKTHRVEVEPANAFTVFTSSGTTGTSTSRHYVQKPSLYEKSFQDGFMHFYGDIKNYCILGLLPSYLEREGSSLVYMVDQLIRSSGHPESGFYLHDAKALAATISRLEKNAQPVILIGVTYALLDFARDYPQVLQHCIVMETGGMKGRQKEITRQELYEELKNAFGLKEIHAEYGMTELLSQAYGKEGFFRTPPWMKVLIRDETDPLSHYLVNNKPMAGGISVIDLANLYSCSFIATEDVGRAQPGGEFEVLGRLDHSDTRGCSLLVI